MFTALLPAFCIFFKSEILSFYTSFCVGDHHWTSWYLSHTWINHFNVYSAVVATVSFHFSVHNFFSTRSLLVKQITIKTHLVLTRIFSHLMLQFLVYAFSDPAQVQPNPINLSHESMLSVISCQTGNGLSSPQVKSSNRAQHVLGWRAAFGTDANDEWNSLRRSLNTTH